MHATWRRNCSNRNNLQGTIGSWIRRCCYLASHWYAARASIPAVLMMPRWESTAPITLPRIRGLERRPAWDQDPQPAQTNGHRLRFTYIGTDPIGIVIPEVFQWNCLRRMPIRLAKDGEGATQVFYPGDRVTLTADAPLLVFIRAHGAWFRRE
jgi:hypothetical protein